MNGIHKIRYYNTSNYTSSIPPTTVAPNSKYKKISNYRALVLLYYFTDNIVKRIQNRDIIKANSGASSTYIRPTHQHYLRIIQKLQEGPAATLPDNTKMQASSKGILPLRESLETLALLYPGLINESLLSIGQLCNQGCVAIFDKYKLYILQNGKQILTGDRNLKDGLWDGPFREKKIHHINCIILKDKKNQT